MIDKRINVLAFVLTTALASYACETTSDKQHKAEQLQQVEAEQAARVQQMRDQVLAQLHDQQLDYTAKVNRLIAETDDQVGILHNATTVATGAAQADYDRTIQDLTARGDVLRADVGTIANATTADWEGVKAKVDKDLDDGRSTMRTASTRIKQLPRETPPVTR